MTNNSLTPKKITDKNGKPTTVHVNPDKGETAGSARVATVGLPPVAQPERKPLVKLEMHGVNFTAGHWISSGGEYDFNAPYQRGSVWDEDRKRNLIRSLIMGVPTGAMIVNIRPKGSEFYGAIVDGKQRIEAVLDYLEDRLAVPAEWFAAEDVESDAEMVKFSEMSKPFSTGFKYMTVIPVMESHVDTIEQEAEIFLLINQGGVEQEESTLAKAKKISEG